MEPFLKPANNWFLPDLLPGYPPLSALTTITTSIITTRNGPIAPR